MRMRKTSEVAALGELAGIANCWADSYAGELEWDVQDTSG